MYGTLFYFGGKNPTAALRHAIDANEAEVIEVERRSQLPGSWTDDQILVLDGIDDLAAAREMLDPVPSDDRKRVLMYADLKGPDEIGAVITRDGIRHVVPTRASERMLLRMIRTLQERSLPTLEALLPLDTKTETLTLASSEERKQAMSDLRTALEELGVRERFVSSALTATDEMLMNGLFDAPTDGMGRHLFVERDRGERVELPEDDQMTLQFAVAEDTLFLCVQDPYGSLPEDAVRTNLERATGRGEDQIKTGSGGAGLGLYMLLDHLTDWITHVVPGQKTRVIGTIAARGSFRAQREAPRLFDLHYDLLNLLF